MSLKRFNLDKKFMCSGPWESTLEFFKDLVWKEMTETKSLQGFLKSCRS